MLRISEFLHTRRVRQFDGPGHGWKALQNAGDVAAGGGSFLASAPGTKVVAFALPSRGASRSAASSSGESPRATAPAAQAASSELPAGPGRENLQRLCGTCHGLATVTGGRRTAADWTKITTDMLARGNAGTPADHAAISGYLTANFGRVDVNTAAPQELAAVLGLTPAEAAAIVEYRTHEGGIRSFDALRNVPGLDPTKLRRMRDAVIISVR